MTNKNEALKRSWTTNAEAWTRAVREDQIESRRVSTNAAILHTIAERPKGRILDLGCGEGWLTRELGHLGFTVTGTDGSVPLIHDAQALGGGHFLHLTYEEIGVNPELLEGPYAYAVCNFSLLGEDLHSLLRALRSNLAPEGLLFIQTLHPHAVTGSEPYQDGWRTETFAGMGAGFEEPMPWYFRTLASWFTAVREGGFQVIDLQEPVHPGSGRPLSLILTARR